MDLADKLNEVASRVESATDVLNTTTLDGEVKELRDLALRARVWQVGHYADDQGYLWEKGDLNDWVSAFRHPFYDKTGELRAAKREVVRDLVEAFHRGEKL